jgi:hypothetical protein
VCGRRREEIKASLVFSKRTTFLQFAVIRFMDKRERERETIQTRSENELV